MDTYMHHMWSLFHFAIINFWINNLLQNITCHRFLCDKSIFSANCETINYEYFSENNETHSALSAKTGKNKNKIKIINP